MYVEISRSINGPTLHLLGHGEAGRGSRVSGVKMEGPYEWVPASYWLLDKEAGGAHGFATRESVPGQLYLARESLPADDTEGASLGPSNELPGTINARRAGEFINKGL